EDERSNKLITKQLKVIDSYFFEQNDDVDYLSAREIEVAIQDRFGNKEIDELLVQEEKLFERKKSLIKNIKLRRTIAKLFDNIDVANPKRPKFPYAEGPREYQKLAFENWKSN